MSTAVWRLLSGRFHWEVCYSSLLQNIEHLKWKPDQLRKAFSFDHLNNAASEWLGQQQLEAVRNNAPTRCVPAAFSLTDSSPVTVGSQ